MTELQTTHAGLDVHETFLAQFTVADDEDVARAERRDLVPLSHDEIREVLSRQTVGSVTHVLDDGHARTTRESYVLSGDVVYLPSSPTLGSFIASWPGARRTIECEINELDGLSEWRYVWLRGTATLLQPTGSAAERDAWRAGVERLRAVAPWLAGTSIEGLAFANFAVVRLADFAPVGVRLSLGDAAVLLPL